MGVESEFPSNSRFAKMTSQPVEEKKVVPVTEGPVVIRKKPLGRRFTELFVVTDGVTVRQHVLENVVLPAIKDLLADTANEAVNQLLFGGSRTSSRRIIGRPGSSGTSGYVNYSSRYNTSSRVREDPRPALSREARATHDFGEIVLSSRHEADEVIKQLNFLIDECDVAALSDLYKLTRQESSHVDEKWGWTNLRDARPQRVSDGYILILPKPEPI